MNNRTPNIPDARVTSRPALQLPRFELPGVARPPAQVAPGVAPAPGPTTMRPLTGTIRPLTAPASFTPPAAAPAHSSSLPQLHTPRPAAALAPAPRPNLPQPQPRSDAAPRIEPLRWDPAAADARGTWLQRLTPAHIGVMFAAVLITLVVASGPTGASLSPTSIAPLPGGGGGVATPAPGYITVGSARERSDIASGGIPSPAAAARLAVEGGGGDVGAVTMQGIPSMAAAAKTATAAGLPTSGSDRAAAPATRTRVTASTSPPARASRADEHMAAPSRSTAAAPALGATRVVPPASGDVDPLTGEPLGPDPLADPDVVAAEQMLDGDAPVPTNAATPDPRATRAMPTPGAVQ